MKPLLTSNASRHRVPLAGIVTGNRNSAPICSSPHGSASLDLVTSRQTGYPYGSPRLSIGQLNVTGTAAKLGVTRLRPFAGADRWLARISVRSRSREYHYKRHIEPEAADRRRVVTIAYADFCSSAGSP